MTDLLCPVCAEREPAPVACEPCTERVRKDLRTILDLRAMLADWTEIDPGTPCLDQPHRLALVDNPVMTASGGPDLTVIAATDIRTRRIIEGWHDDQEPADDVVNVDHELLTEARLIVEDRGLSMPPTSIDDCLTIIEASFEWSIRSPRVDEFAAVMASCALGLRALMRDLPDPPLRCPQPDPQGIENACGGPLRWRSDTTAWSSEDDDLAAVELVCGRCSDVWGVHDLPGVLRAVKPEMRFPVGRAWVSERYGVNAITLRSWVRRGHVRTFADEQVDLFDVLARVQEG